MSDNHEKFQNGFDPNNGSEPANTNTSANNAVNSTNAYGTYHNAQYPTNNTPAYTWNAQSAPQQNAPVQPNGQPVYYGVPVHQPQKQPKPKKHGSKFGLKLLAVVLCCAITSAASLGVFVAMIQNGFINVQSSEASSNAAFTISRVVNGDTSSDTSASSDGTVSAMSDQDIAAKLTPSVVCIQNYQVTQNYGGFFGIATVIAAGNETGLSHHYAGQLSADTPYEDVELRVGEREAERGFILELWSSATELFTVGFVSPGGERINRIPVLANNETRIPFLLENTILTVNYELIEAGSGSQLVSVRFERPSAGIWTIRVYNTQFLTGEYHMWLPVQGFISEETVFLKPDPSNTITVPGNSRLPITVGAYDHRNNSIYIHSSRGYTSRDYVKPDLAAPGVDVLGPGIRDTSGAGVRSFLYSGNNIPSITPSQNTPSNISAPSSIQENLQTFSRRTGTSAAAAITAGAVANLLSWGIVMGNYPAMSEATIKSYLIRGAARNPALSYPNREFGYGTLDLLQTFLRLRE